MSLNVRGLRNSSNLASNQRPPSEDGAFLVARQKNLAKEEVEKAIVT